MFIKNCAFLFLIVTATGRPSSNNDEQMMDVAGDTAVVESIVRETRAIIPDSLEDLLKPGVKAAYFSTYGDDENDDTGVQGYHKKTQDKGNDGYKHYDSYHKKDGDKYGYEKHSEYGKHNKHKAEAAEKDYYKNNKAQEDDGKSETKNAYRVSEDINEGKKGVRAITDFDTGYYGDSGDSEHYIEGDDGESASYTEGDDGESEQFIEGGDEGEGESEHYESEGGDDGESGSLVEYDEGGESEALNEGEEDYY